MSQNISTWDRRLYFPSEGSRAADFYRPKNEMSSAGFGPVNLGPMANTIKYLGQFECSSLVS
jgi:hypothetical protein